MMTRYLLPLLAIAGVSFAVFTVVQARQDPPVVPPVVVPPAQPEFPAIAGAGLIEARAENITVGTAEPGLVWEVLVEEGRRVAKGDPLFRLDDRNAQAELTVRRAALAAAQAQLERLRQAPRFEDIPPARAALAEAQARLNDAEIQYTRTRGLFAKGVVTDSERDRDRYGYEAARAGVDRAQAELVKIESGTWSEDLRVAEAAVAEAQARLEAAQIGLDRLTVRALDSGEVLQVNVRPGQFAALTGNDALIVLGDLDVLHVRVDIDEQDVPFFEPSLQAVASVRGRPQDRLPLRFVRVDPYVIPKRSLTGDNAERVDTRVLQVIYALPIPRPDGLYVGQQMDVFLESPTVRDKTVRAATEEQTAPAPGVPPSWGRGSEAAAPTASESLMP